MTVKVPMAEILFAKKSDVDAVADGDVVGPASATDNAVVRYDAATGKLVQNSGVLISDTDSISGVENITLSGTMDGRDVAADGVTADAALARTGGQMTGNITMAATETVDGRDLSVDGTKLDGVETSATADQTGAEIKTAYEANADTNAFDNAEQTKLAGVATGAEVNPDLISQAEVEAGSATTERIFSALRVKQAIIALETGAHPVVDSTSLVEDGADPTKEMRIDVGAVATGTIRVLTIPNQDVDLTPDTGTFQASDAGLLSIAALGTAADKIAYTTGVDTWAETAITTAGRALIDDAAASNQRTTLGLVIGTDVSALTGANAALESFTVAVGDETTAITTGTAKITFRMPYAFTLAAGNAGVRASLNTVSSSGIPTVDINEGGATILSTKLTIDASEKTSLTAAAAVVISDTALADDAEITIDIDVAGTGAKGLKIVFRGRQA